ncbi:MAG: hypothetical protein RJA70_1159 [Pseudomonadota bacterium]|jgi:hypothetical protein
MAPPTAVAQAAARPKRLVIMYTCNGKVLNTWTPGEFGPNYTVSRTLKPLDTPALRPHLTVLSGLQMQAAIDRGGNGHNGGMTSMLTGLQSQANWGGGISIDQHIAQSLRAERPAGSLPSLELGIDSKKQYNSAYAYMSYSAAGSANAVAADDTPLNAYMRAFSNVVVPMPTADQADARARLEREILARKSVLDFVQEDFKSISGRLGADDQARLDQHATLLRDLEGRLSVGGAACTLPQQPAAASNFPAVGQAQMDIISSAFACDVTRVATLQWAAAQSDTDHKEWAPGSDGRHHIMSHGAQPTQGMPPAQGDVGGNNEKLTRINTWYASQLAYLATALSKIDDGGGQTGLDNTAILWVTEVSEGPNHKFTDMPWLLVGGLGGALKKGEHIDVKGRNNNDLFITLGQAMGLPNFTTFGDPAYCTGPIAQLMA